MGSPPGCRGVCRGRVLAGEGRRLGDGEGNVERHLGQIDHMGGATSPCRLAWATTTGGAAFPATST